MMLIKIVIHRKIKIVQKYNWITNNKDVGRECVDLVGVLLYISNIKFEKVQIISKLFRFNYKTVISSVPLCCPPSF